MRLYPDSRRSPLARVLHVCYGYSMAAHTKPVTISLRLGERMRADVEQAAASEEMTIAEWLRIVIRERLAAKASA